jgi:hypothetical protein
MDVSQAIGAVRGSAPAAQLSELEKVAIKLGQLHKRLASTRGLLRGTVDGAVGRQADAVDIGGLAGTPTTMFQVIAMTIQAIEQEALLIDAETVRLHQVL